MNIQGYLYMPEPIKPEPIRIVTPEGLDKPLKREQDATTTPAPNQQPQKVKPKPFFKRCGC